MTQTAAIAPRRFGEWRIIAPVCAAHFVSHYYIIMLAPLFVFVRADYSVSYTDLAVALTAFNVVSATFQTPVGFLVDRVAARIVLSAGVALGAAAFAVAGLVDSFAAFIAMYAVAGLGNTRITPRIIRCCPITVRRRALVRIFRFHTFSGILGAAVAPATLLAMQSWVGWRGAYVGAATLGFAVLALLIAQRPTPADRLAETRRTPTAGGAAEAALANDAGWRLLLSPPILFNLGFFILFSLMGGLSNFLVVALGALYGTSDTLANMALSGLLLMNALGVLVGGVLASRPPVMPPLPRSVLLSPGSSPRSSA